MKREPCSESGFLIDSVSWRNLPTELYPNYRRNARRKRSSFARYRSAEGEQHKPEPFCCFGSITGPFAKCICGEAGSLDLFSRGQHLLF